MRLIVTAIILSLLIGIVCGDPIPVTVSSVPPTSEIPKSTPESIIYTSERSITTTESIIYTSEPSITTTESIIYTSEPSITTTESTIYTSESPITTTEHEMVPTTVKGFDKEHLFPPPKPVQAEITPPKTGRLPCIPPPPPVPPERKPFGRPPPPPPPASPHIQESVTDYKDDLDGTDAGLYNHGYIEGDITPPKGLGRVKNAIASPNLKWPYGAIVFKVHESVGCPDSPQCEILMKAMQHYHRKGCVRFKEWTGEENSVNVFLNSDSGACWSSVGRTGEEEQHLSLGERCWYLGIVIHELAHAVGFWHEMNRPDRDNYIWVYWNNIVPGFQAAFSKMEPASVDTLGEKFDYKSIMMYDEYAFSKDGISATLQAKKERTIIGPIWRKRGLSGSDIRRLHKLYSCQGNKELPGFPYDIHCDFDRHQCGFKNGGFASWHYRNFNTTDGYLYVNWDDDVPNIGFLQSINFHPTRVDTETESLGCLRFWYYIDSDASAELMVWHAYLDQVTQLMYSPDKIFQLWEDGNVTKSWIHVDIPLYVSRPFKLIFVSIYDEKTTSGTIALDDVELLYLPCLEDKTEPETPAPEIFEKPHETTTETKSTTQTVPTS